MPSINSFPFFLASRLGRRQAANGAHGSPGARIAVAGVALALAAMIVAVSVMLGFKKEIRSKIIAFDSELSIITADASEPVYDYPGVVDAAKKTLPPGARLSATARQPVVLKTDSAFAGLIYKGIDNDAAARLIAGSIIDGKMPDYSSSRAMNRVVISRDAARRLGLKAGDKVFAFFTMREGVKTRRLVVAGIYDTHFGDYDAVMAIGSLKLLQQVSRATPNTCSAIEITGLGSDREIDEAAGRLLKNLTSSLPGTEYAIGNVHDTAAIYFNWLALLDTNVAVLLALLGVVAGFTIISSLFTIILEKVPAIGLLKALGATTGAVSRVFVIIALRLVARGLLIGDVLGLGLVLAQKWLKFLPLNPDSYYLDTVPVEVSWAWVAGLNAGIIVIAYLLLILPARIVSTISPSRVMRFE